MFLLFTSFGFAEDSKAGEIEGLLIEKGKNFILVIPDGGKEAIKYIPEWIGGNPKDGGGLKKDTLEKMKKLIVPNRVWIKWKFEEHNRVLDVKVLEPEKNGICKGVITAKEKNWIEVSSEEGGKVKVDRFMPKWIGGNPKDGGGLDKEIVAKLEKIKKGDKVSVKWEYDERKRVVGIEK